MFFVRYARSELTRRRGRTIVTVSGLALGVALVIVIASLTRGLDEAQDKALDPLASIGTDLTVTLAPEEGSGGGFGSGGGGGGREVVQATARSSPTSRSSASRGRSSRTRSSCRARS
jgi:ABC-type antimicrobial peptide transport system permease subunit